MRVRCGCSHKLTLTQQTKSTQSTKSQQPTRLSHQLVCLMFWLLPLNIGKQRCFMNCIMLINALIHLRPFICAQSFALVRLRSFVRVRHRAASTQTLAPDHKRTSGCLTVPPALVAGGNVRLSGGWGESLRSATVRNIAERPTRLHSNKRERSATGDNKHDNSYWRRTWLRVIFNKLMIN